MNLTKSTTAIERMKKSTRNGQHATTYELMRDPKLQNKDVIRDLSKPVFPFISGSTYKGQWNEDRKEGFGTQVYPDGTKYEGEWVDNNRHGNGTLFLKRGKRYIQQYVGYWTNGCMEGVGTFHYDNGDIYEGSWSRNKRSGNGRLKFPNGDYYVGEWDNDVQQGLGSLYLANGNIFEGLWSGGKREGRGKFFYASTSKVYEGEWVDDQPRCGEYRAPFPTEVEFFGKPSVRKEIFDLPEIGLENPRAVLDLAVSEVRQSRATLQGMVECSLSEVALQRAEKVFDNLDTSRSGVVSMWLLVDVFSELGLQMSIDDLRDIASQLELGMDVALSFPEVVDIASFLTNESAAVMDAEY